MWLNNLLNHQIDIYQFYILSGIIFTIGICGMSINRKNIILMLMSLELVLLSVNINFVAASMKFHNIIGQVFSIFVLAIAAAETAIGLAILVIYFRNRNTVTIDASNQMRG